MFPHERGLTNEEAKKRLNQYGLNVLPEKPPPTSLSLLLSQLKNPLIYVLIFAGLLTLVLRHFADATLIFLAVGVNAILGFIQEKKAGDALSALKKFVTHRTEIIREGKREKIDATHLVPGDIVILSHGTKVPADGELLFANRLFFDEAIITGESMAVAKKKTEKIYMGTTVVAGQGVMTVTTTGEGTKIGTIAEELLETKEDTPLKRQLSDFSQKLVYVVIGTTLLVLLVGLIRGEGLVEMIKVAVALAVSSIPEGLIISMTVVLAIGMQKILKRQGLVRKLASAETLGGVTTICIDKTGTLTEGLMHVVDYRGNKTMIAEQMVLANDMDDPLVIAGFTWGQQFASDAKDHPRRDSIPFSPKERFFASLHTWDREHSMLFVHGAPDTILAWCTVDKRTKERVQKDIDMLTTQGKRLMGLARKEMPRDKGTISPDDAKHGLSWVGLLVFSDPVRAGVADALGKVRHAGIRLMVITGDYPQTARHVLSEIGIPTDDTELIVGSDLEKLSVMELAQKIKTVKLFARTTPEQKLKIVEALKKNGEVVAMMGDGVNDAPALHEADIGIVVENASDVARETADLILLDSNFTTVVSAIEEGRGMFDNIRKIILYLMSDAFGEIVVVIGSILLGLPLPITAVQILWINLISDGFPFFALTIDPKRKDIMTTPPRRPQERLVNGWMMSLIGTVSATSGLIALTFFAFVYQTTGDITLARSIVFITLGINSLIYVFSTRTLLSPFWKNNLFQNRWLLLAVALGFGLQIAPFSLPSLHGFFSITRPSFHYWLIAITFSILLFFIVEIFKFLYQKRPQRHLS